MPMHKYLITILVGMTLSPIHVLVPSFIEKIDTNQNLPVVIENCN